MREAAQASDRGTTWRISVPAESSGGGATPSVSRRARCRHRARSYARADGGTHTHNTLSCDNTDVQVFYPFHPLHGVTLHEIKYDGYRVQLHVNKQRRTIFTRVSLDWTKRFSVIAGAFDVPVERAILDGEIVVVKDGHTSFSELQAELAKGNQDSLLFYAFDPLYLEGFDLRRTPLVERKRILKMLFDETGLESPIIYSEHLQIEG